MVVDPVTLVVGGTATVVVLSSLAFLEWRAGKKRAAAFQAFAQNMGLAVDSDALSALEALGRFKVWRAGRDQRAKNILVGTRDGRPVLLFDFGYTTGSGKSSTKHTHTVCLIAGPSTAPDFLARRRTVLDKLASAFTGKHLEFDDPAAAAFAKEWVVFGERDAHRLFSSSLQGFFVDTPASFEAEQVDGALLVDFTTEVDAGELATVLSTAINLRRHWS
jgi:hypothetical protein